MTSPNTGATNSSGFTGLPSGYRETNGTFDLIGHDGIWWSGTESSSSNAWNRFLEYSNVFAVRGVSDKRIGISVRCVRD
ncbi:MAG: hypothetical protein IPL46_25710 [Saprospiraceae bacterium]|nr:hypothetical protein [Saprospiraceae bacterium]